MNNSWWVDEPNLFYLVEGQALAPNTVLMRLIMVFQLKIKKKDWKFENYFNIMEYDMIRALDIKRTYQNASKIG